MKSKLKSQEPREVCDKQIPPQNNASIAGDNETNRASVISVAKKQQLGNVNALKLFIPIVDNEYRSKRNISKEDKDITCDCLLTRAEIKQGKFGCGMNCLNRILNIECGPQCQNGDRCTNKCFQEHQSADCYVSKTEKKGYGVFATSFIPSGRFLMEYVGEVLNTKQFQRRCNEYSRSKNVHFYFMSLANGFVIDATKRGTISRFINHSCDPNAEAQKWMVNGQLRIGLFSTKAIRSGEEIAFDYNIQRYGKIGQRCFCGAENCCGWIGGAPDSERGEEERWNRDELAESNEVVHRGCETNNNCPITNAKFL